ncbi:MAG: peptidyl-prolyl cis-trans isomerase [Lachnospiraceae bacterium]|nr:peptidyl-prolyl cis-trans isomerase [Lachnospiraceae bacterium]
MKKKMACLIALMLTASMMLGGCSGSTIDYTAEAVSVDGVSIPLAELNFYLRYQQVEMQSMYATYFGDDFMNQDLTGTGSVYGETVRDSVLEMLEEFYVIEAHADELGVSLDEDDESAIAEAVETFLAANDSDTLSLMSADEETVTHVLELLRLQVKVYNYLATTIDTEVDEEEAAQKCITYVSYSTAGTTDDDGNTVDLTDEELDEIRTELETIRDEAEESGDLSTAAEDHELSAVTTTYGSSDETLDENLKAAADELSDGEFADIVEGDGYYYLVYMESTYDEDATQTEIESILEEREQEAYSDWLDALVEEAEIVVNDSVIEKLNFERIFTEKTEEETVEDDAEAATDETVEDDAEESTEEEAAAEEAETEESEE